MVSFNILSATIVAGLTAVNAAELLSTPNSQDVIKDSYIVVMKDGIQEFNLNSHMAWVRGLQDSGTVCQKKNISGMESIFDVNGFKGYVGCFDRETLDQILSNDQVKYVEPNRVIRYQEQVQNRVDRRGLFTQRNAPNWGLGRISSRKAGSRDYYYHPSGGKGIFIYLINTGTDVQHPDIDGRAIWGVNFADNDEIDNTGGGTHAAGVAIGTRYGVAKKARIISVKVLNGMGTGSLARTLAGIDWSVKNATERRVLGKAIMSFGISSSTSQAVNDAVDQASRAGILIVAPAGNDNEDASNSSPGSASSACTVGASNIRDTRTVFSNYGKRVDIFAPGQDIAAPIPGGRYETRTGTSISGAHVAGLGAYLMSLEGLTPEQVCGRIKQLGNPVLNGTNGSTILLAYNGSGR